MKYRDRRRYSYDIKLRTYFSGDAIERDRDRKCSATFTIHTYALPLKQTICKDCMRFMTVRKFCGSKNALEPYRLVAYRDEWFQGILNRKGDREDQVFSIYVTPRKIVFEKLTTAQLVKELPTFYGIRSFQAVFTKSRHWNLCRAS